MTQTLSPISYLLAFALTGIGALGCGDDGGEAADAMPAIDAMPAGPADAAVGVQCEFADANYSGVVATPLASRIGGELRVTGALNGGGAPDLLRLTSEAASEMQVGSFQLPAGPWTVEICLDSSEGSCDNSLVSYSGELTVTSAEGRFQGRLDRVIFVDTRESPSCSASLSQASFDLAIGGQG